MACAHAQIAAAILRSTPSEPSDREAAAERHAVLAVLALTRAVASGTLRGAKAGEEVLIDPDLDPLRLRPDFRLLSMDLAMPTDPFTR
jgi:hypothetical protein